MDDRQELVASSPLSGQGEPACWRCAAVNLTERMDLGLLHLRGRLDGIQMERIGEALGQSLPLTCLTIGNAPVRILRLRADHWCLVVNEECRASTLRSLREAARASSALVSDVSGGAVWISVEGQAAAELIATGCAIDLDQHALPVGHAAWTRLGRLRVLLIRDGIERFLVQFDAPCATHGWQWLVANATLIDALLASRSTLGPNAQRP